MDDRFRARRSRSGRSLRRPSACPPAGGASCDGVGLLTSALLLRQERGRGARANPDFRSGRQPAVSAPTPDCCIDPAVRKSIDLEAGAPWVAVLLGEAKQQRHAETARRLLRPAWPALSERAARAAAHQSNSDRTERCTRAPAQKEQPRGGVTDGSRVLQWNSRSRADRPATAVRPPRRYNTAAAPT